MSTFNLLAAVANIVDLKGQSYLERPAGSWAERNGTILSGEEAQEMLSNAIFTEITEQVRLDGAGFGLTRYFQSTLPEGTTGFEAAVKLSEFLDMGFTAEDYQEVDGHHCKELQSSVIKPQETKQFVVAVGSPGNPFEDEFTLEEGLVYFWAPGRCLPPSNVVKLQR